MNHRSLLVFLLCILVAGAWALPAAAQPSAEAPCTARLSRGADVGAALDSAAPDSVLCLASGVYPPFHVGAATASGVTIRGVGRQTVVTARESTAITVAGVERLTLEDMTVRARLQDGIAASGVTALTLRRLRVEGGSLGIVLDDGSRASLESITVADNDTAGLVLRGRADATAERFTAEDSGGVGVAVLNDGARLTLRDSTIVGGPGPAIFAGVPGCAELGVATLEAPSCFYDDLDAYISDVQVSLDRVTIDEGAGAGVVLFPGVRATLRNATVRGRQLGGLRAWGAAANVSDSLFDGNAGDAIEYRAYPDPRDAALRHAGGTIDRTTIRLTNALGGPVLGDGIVARAAIVSVLESQVAANDGRGIAFEHGAVGEVAGATVANNRGAGICLTSGEVRFGDNAVSGNGSNEIGFCR